MSKHSYRIVLGICLCAVISLCAEEPEEGVRIGTQVFSFQKGLPLLTAMLDGTISQKMEALSELSYYGDTLCGSETFKKALRIATAPNEYPMSDSLLVLSPEDQRIRRQQPLTAERQAEGEMFTIQLMALSIVACCDDERSKSLVREFATSASPTKQYMANSISDLLKIAWNSGRMHPKAKKPPEPIVSAATNAVSEGKAVKSNAAPPQVSILKKSVAPSNIVIIGGATPNTKKPTEPVSIQRKPSASLLPFLMGAGALALVAVVAVVVLKGRGKGDTGR